MQQQANPNFQQPNDMQQQLQMFEGFCDTLYANAGSTTQQQKQQADESLKKFTEDVQNLAMLRYFMENSNSKYVKYLSASAMKQLFTQHWLKIPVEEKMNIKEYMLGYLREQGPQCDQEVLKMVITVLAKITKMSWFDHPQLQGIVQDLTQLQTLSERHLYISLTAIHDLIIEMSYVHKVKNLTVNRRISLSFRDSALFQIFTQSLAHVTQFTDQILAQQGLQSIAINQNLQMQQMQSNVGNCDILCESLLQALSILEKSLSFDFTAILLNETLDDPSSTNIPTAWRQYIEDPQTLQGLFKILTAEIRNQQSTMLKMKAAQCLGHLANTRHSLFESSEKRIAFVTTFVTELIKFFQSPALHTFVFKERQIYKEFIPILIKIQSNFQVRDLSKAGDALLEGYLTELYQFTVQSYKTPSESIKFHSSRLNHLWQRVFFESMALNVSCQNRLEDIIKQLIQAYLDENLQQKGMNLGQAANDEEDNEDDEDENFEKSQRTQRHDDLDWFSKLMKQKIEDSLTLILMRFTHIIQQYELFLSQGNQAKSCKTCERQLTYLIRVTNSLFSYGLPSGQAKLSLLRKKQAQSDDELSRMNQSMDQQQQPPKPQFLDFQIVEKVLYICKITNQIRQTQNARKVETELESSLLSFAIAYKNHILTDSRLILLGTNLSNDPEADDALDTLDGVYNESKTAYQMLAQLSGQSNMDEILDIFAQKIIQNLMTSAVSDKEEDRRIVDLSLEVFSSYLNNSVSSRQLASLPVVKQLAAAHITQFSILQAPSQQKQLGQFFRVLTSLWVSEDFVKQFHEYLDQLVPQIQQLFSMDVTQLQQTPQAREEVMKLFYILRGILRGLNNSKNFNLFFEWFYPQYFSVIIEGALNAFHEDDEVVMCTFKFLTELVLNRNNRVRFDTWSINGLIVFKETAKYVVQLLQLWDCFRKKPIKADIYKEKWKHVKIVCQLYHNMIAGNYVNFAICEYYNDSIFTELSQLVFTSATSCDIREMCKYEKVNRKVFMVSQHFFNHHLEVMFMKFDHKLIESMLTLMVHGMQDSAYDVQADSCACINAFNEYVFEKMQGKKTSTQGSAQLVQCVQQFYTQSSHVFQNFFKAVLFTLLFEENKNIWVFQKVLHSTLVIVNQQGVIQQIVVEVLNENEKNDERRQSILTQISEMISSLPLNNLDQKERETFGQKFNALKSFIYNL